MASVGLVLLALVGCGSDDRSSAPSDASPISSPLTTSPTTTAAAGPPPRIPWWSRGALHVDGGTIRTPLSRVVAGGPTTLVGRAEAGGSTWRRVVADRLEPLLTTRSQAVMPRVSADGAYVAWVTSRDLHRYDEYTTRTAFTITAYDVVRGRRIGSATLVRRVTCCDAGGVVGILGVNLSGAVVLHAVGGGSWVWRPGRPPVRIRLPDDQWLDASDQWPHGITFATSQDGAGPGAFARVDRDGRVHRVGRVPEASTGVWSPDGSAYAYLPFSKGPENAMRPVVWNRAGRQRLDAPRGSAVLMWESATSLLLDDTGDADSEPLRLVRCDVGTGACERAGRPLRHVHLPETLHF